MWEKVIENLKNKVETQDLEKLSLVEPIFVSEDKITLAIPGEQIKELLKSKYKNQLKESLKLIFNKLPKIELIIKTQDKDNLNSKYGFENFVVGPSNQLAYAASVAVSENPAKAYNPLFIYGGVGLGKTHLLHAIGNSIKKNNPNARVLYISSEEFTNELINSIQYKKMTQFRNKYRNLDCLLIDDIQFISKKERTEEEFFHTFNALYESQKQIIITSDKPPNEIPDIENRLKSRFSWGLIVDIQPPELETRIAIIRKKAELFNLEISQEIIEFIASSISSNVREIEGALIKISAYKSIMRKPVTLNLVKSILQDIIIRKEKMLTAENIQKTVAKHFNISVDSLKSSTRKKEILIPREIAMYLTRKITKNSLPEIKAKFGVKSHATIINACKRIESEMEKDINLKKKVEEIEKEITDV
ncbi:chromosomal replication initiator protein DnaA [Hippea maritima]|uniref:Chromosomal replication initiator protein DnaA n=1 Tax=Hippea maritima (strain ATCC 700847 / DSM 10411 / MH2) TaxID=760142 RepID=F2LWD8_HIPMA|nr:chromosomal replication initiator protein DnaA [Hippea maritima]AEA32984.1 Chromosomal replication initiator protein dnaA [Hippea maritima DSM 10411]